jgi:FAD/FMN-containing dehydrogenase
MVAAGLAACGGGGSGSSAPPAPPDWNGLAAGLQGMIVNPSDATFADLALVFNRRFDATAPIAIVRCASTADVVETLQFIKKNNFTFVPRCGGHNYAGYSATGGIMLDVRPMNTVQVNGDGTATIGAGALLVDVYTQLIAQGVCISSGTCPTVGIAGITMGGGISVIDRQHGLTCDNLVSAQVVTADGQVRTCSATSEPDLFWALRGGGGGNFGVATSFTFQTHPVTELTTFSAYFDFVDAAKVIAAWQAWPQALPNNIWAQITVGYGGLASPSVYLDGVCIGTPDDLNPVWESFLGSLGVTAYSPNSQSQTYLEVMLSLCGDETDSQCHFIGETSDAKNEGAKFVGSSDFFNAPLPAEGIQAFLDAMTAQNNAGVYGYVILDLMQGAIAQTAVDATAFPHRQALFSAEYWQYVLSATDSLTWANDMRSLMSPWSSGGAYVNYMDPLIQDWPDAYYGANYNRLQQVKAQYDPTGLFRFPQGVRA